MSIQHRGRTEEDTALDLLHDEHVALLATFERLRTGAAASRKISKILTSACHMLLRHAQIEQELFYPALRGVSGLDDLLDAARIEHRTMNELIFELINARPRNGLRAARIEALAMYVAHHFREEEEKLFPRARAAGIDLTALRRRIIERSAELEAEGQPTGCEATV
ncbi:MAG TPA: hemerythrin domain-containing protein [Casimicrobiaceae bacterium]